MVRRKKRDRSSVYLLREFRAAPDWVMLTGRLGMLDSTPQSPTPGLSRTQSMSGVATPDRLTAKTVPFPTSFISPSRPETSSVSALGENGWSDDEEDRKDRVRRELSVIDEGEKDGSSMKTREEGEGKGAEDQSAGTEAADDEEGESSLQNQSSTIAGPTNEAGSGGEAEQAESDVDGDDVKEGEEGDQTPRVPIDGETADPLVDATAVPDGLASQEPGGPIPVTA